MCRHGSVCTCVHKCVSYYGRWGSGWSSVDSGPSWTGLKSNSNKLLCLSLPQFLHLLNGENNITGLTVVVRIEMIQEGTWSMVLVHRKCLISVSINICHVSMCICVREMGCVCVCAHMWVMSTDMWAALQRLHEHLEGTCAGILETESHQAPQAAWCPPRSPGPPSPYRKASSLGSLLPRSPLPWGGGPKRWSDFFLLWAAQVFCCLSISSGCKSVEIFFYQRPVTSKRNQAGVICKNQLNLGSVFPWKITKELNSSAFQIKNSKWHQCLKKKKFSYYILCEIAL